MLQTRCLVCPSSTTWSPSANTWQKLAGPTSVDSPLHTSLPTLGARNLWPTATRNGIQASCVFNLTHYSHFSNSRVAQVQLETRTDITEYVRTPPGRMGPTSPWECSPSGARRTCPEVHGHAARLLLWHWGGNPAWPQLPAVAPLRAFGHRASASPLRAATTWELWHPCLVHWPCTHASQACWGLFYCLCATMGAF